MNSYFCEHEGCVYIVTADDHAMALRILKRDFDIEPPELRNVIVHSRWAVCVTRVAVIAAVYAFHDGAYKTVILRQGPVQMIADAFERGDYRAPYYDGVKTRKIICCLKEKLDAV